MAFIGHWSMGGAARNHPDQIEPSVWTMFQAAGLVCLVESGPRFGRNRDPPPWVLDEFEMALASSHAAHRYTHMDLSLIHI